MKATSIDSLNNVAQSIWYDNLSRDVLQSGELKDLIQSGVSGLTSNPTIFKKAIADTALYDVDITTLASQGLGVEAVCEELMVRDVAAAADLLRPTYDRTSGADGHASIEVSPFLARDAKTTIEAAQRLWDKLKRPNIMIKIPGTPECLPAIEHVIAQGINVNITLLFSLQDYEQVVERYFAGLETRVKNSQAIKDIASVASFFVSRVDAIVEQRLEALAKCGTIAKEQQLETSGKVGIANARIAYAAYQQLFPSKRFAKLKEKGARPQRPLWASTGTKNPALHPLLYVKELAGADTVNTLPPATLKELIKDTNTYENRIQDQGAAEGIIAALNRSGLPFGALMRQLQDDGVELFAQSYRDLIAAVEKKMSQLKK